MRLCHNKPDLLADQTPSILTFGRPAASLSCAPAMKAGWSYPQPSQGLRPFAGRDPRHGVTALVASTRTATASSSRRWSTDTRRRVERFSSATRRSPSTARSRRKCPAHCRARTAGPTALALKAHAERAAGGHRRTAGNAALPDVAFVDGALPPRLVVRRPGSNTPDGLPWICAQPASRESGTLHPGRGATPGLTIPATVGTVTRPGRVASGAPA